MPAATRQTTPSGRYVAVGDSVAAGIGLDTYSDSSACDRTTQAYPNIIAASLNYTLYSVACSGAATQAGLLGSLTVNRLALKPQIDSVLSGSKPKLVTMTIGANDTNWITLTKTCYTGECGSAADTAAAMSGTASITSGLRKAMDQIKARYPQQPPQVVISGYYRLFPDQLVAGCPELTGIDQSEIALINRLQASIESALQHSVQGYDFASYAPINFSGHELCSADPWVQGLSAKEPFHPTAAGQTAMARQILQVIHK